MSIDQMSVDKMSVDQTSVDQMSVDQISVNQMSVDQMSVNQMFIDQKTWNRYVFVIIEIQLLFENKNPKIPPSQIWNPRKML